MPRGIKGSGVQVAGQPMTNEDIALAEARIKGQRAPLHEDDFKGIEETMVKRDVMKTPDGRSISRVGNFMSTPVVGDQQTLKRFARIEPDWSNWTAMKPQEMMLLQDLRVLIGWDGDKQLALVDDRKLAMIKQKAKQGLLSDKDMAVLEQLEEIQ